MLAVKSITTPTDQVGESPVWRASERALYWVDITGRWVHRFELETARRSSWRTHEQVACIAFDSVGDLVAGMETGIFRLVLKDDGTAHSTLLAAPEFPMTNMRFNDGRCDRQGRFWAGTMHRDMPMAHAVGALYRLDGEGMHGPLLPGLVVQNGLAWSPDGRTMYLSDSHPTVRKVWAFDYDLDTGMPSRQRVLLDMAAQKGRPDGAAVDVDGCYWLCANDGGQVQRYSPEGMLMQSIDLPVSKPAMCAFGGDDLRTLFITSIQPADLVVRAHEPLAGAVFAVQTDTQGLPEPEFSAGRQVSAAG